MDPSKTIFVLNINNYEPEITKYTYPLIESYADRIGAKVKYITKRKYPDHPITFEKFQIYDLADTDWSVYVDSDILIHPEFYDLCPLIPQDTVLINKNNVALGRYAIDKYFRRDGRYISTANYISWVSSDCLDFWKPDLDRTPEEIVSSIYPVPRENFHTPQHRTDDYLCSRNISKYGLKVKLVSDIYQKYYNHSRLEYYYHPDIMADSKLEDVERVHKIWFPDHHQSD